MPIGFDTRLSFADPEILRYLEDDSTPGRDIEPQVDANFAHDPADRRESGEPRVHTEQVIFLVEEQYQLLEQGNGVGIHHAVVALQHNVHIAVDYWLFIRSALAQEAKDHVKERFHAYDPLQDGEDVVAWMRANLGGIVDEADFEVEVCLRLKKDQPQAQDFEVSQRKALFALFGVGGGDLLQSEIHLVGDYSLHQWARDRDVHLLFIGRELVADDSTPPADPNLVREVVDANDPQTITDAVDAIVDHVIPSNCGPMQLKQLKLLSLAAWPEFKIEWKTVRITIGCSRITISVPVLRVRISELIFYVYFKVPQSIDRFVIRIAETCAVRSALGSAVIGVVTSNIGAAVASFTPLFKRCIEQEIRNCLFPGLLLAKEPGPWH